MRKVIVNIARLVLAIVLILSGFVKAVDPLGTQYKIADYLEVLHLGQYVPDIMTLSAAIMLSAIEFGLGICLLFAIRRRLVSRLVLVLMLIMTPLTLWLALANPISDCGCFGDAVVLTNWQTFWKNVVLLSLAVIVRRWPLEMMRFVSRTNQWIVTNYSALFIIVVSSWSLYDLPYFDFRPYHVGANLREGWQQMMDGHDSPYADFFIERMEDGEDITEEVFNNPGYTFLLVSPHLELANDSQLDQLNELYEYADDMDYPFYCLTASGRKGIHRWKDITGCEYPFCQTDETVLRTIIRSNPGLLLLKNGKVIGKWSHNRLPVIEEHLEFQPLEKHAFGRLPKDSIPQKILIILLWYVLPLLLLTIADRLWAWSGWVQKKGITYNIHQLFNNKRTMRKKIVAGNWKMNLNLQEGVALAKELNEALKAEKPNCDVVICTPFIHLASVAQVLEGSVIGLGAENCFRIRSACSCVSFPAATYLSSSALSSSCLASFLASRRALRASSRFTEVSAALESASVSSAVACSCSSVSSAETSTAASTSVGTGSAVSAIAVVPSANASANVIINVRFILISSNRLFSLIPRRRSLCSPVDG